MQAQLLLATALVAAAPHVAHAAAALRLPSTITPSRYAVTFEPDLGKGTFAGEESIELDVKAPASTIVLHAVDLAISEARVRAGSETLTAQVSYDKPNEVARLALPHALTGKVTVELAWTAKLGGGLRGLYHAEADGRHYAFTQFEATDARRAFPCLDEPAYKARFAITALIDPADRAVSNGAVAEETRAHGKKVVRFAETPPMSSYLVALAVGPLVEVKGPAGQKVPVRAWVTPGKEKLAGYAIQAASKLLDLFADYFGMAYPFGKLDLVAVPDFAAGAMENTGAIFFRETALLLDEKTASAAELRDVALVVAHEMAHQWFGDLVTMQWWDDLWLNEAFATWMENKVVDRLKPEWKIWLDFEGNKTYALGVDALASTHPIHTPVASAEEANENFDGITYSKGASVLRMLETWLGEEKFRTGVQKYLAAHKYGNATAHDLWTALASASSQPVAEVATSWFEQPGFPLVDVESRCLAGKTALHLKQQRFFADRREAGKAKATWLIPVCAAPAGSGAKTCMLMRGSDADLALPDACGEPVVVNADRNGFYRVRYAVPALQALSPVALTKLTIPQRLGLVDDRWSLTRQGGATLDSWLDLVAALEGEPSREVLDELQRELEWLDAYLLSDGDRPAFAKLVEALARPLYRELGWAPKKGEEDGARLLRGTVLELLGSVARAPDVMGEAQRRVRGYLENPASLDGTVGEAIVSIAARGGDRATFDAYLQHLRAARDPQQKSQLLHALADFEQPELVARALGLLLGPDVRSQDVGRMVARMLGNPKARPQAWRYLRLKFEPLKQKAPPFLFDRVVGATGAFCDEPARKEVVRFFTEHKVESAERALKQAEESIRLCVDMKQREAPNLSRWLNQSHPSGGTL